MIRFSFYRYAYVVMLITVCLKGLYLYYIVSSPTESDDEPQKIKNLKKCYFHNGRNPHDTGKEIMYFDDLLTSVEQPEYDRGIFFVQTACSESGIADMRPRDACSVEAAAKLNPERDVFVVFLSPVGLPRQAHKWSTTIKTLSEYPNIHFRNVQLKQLCANTPLEKWIESSPELFKSHWVYTHVADVLRVLLVHKYGGAYFDLDYILFRSLEAVKSNWIAVEISDFVNNAAFDFRRSGIGHIVMNEVLNDIIANYKPYCWECNGPRSFQRVLETICNEDDLRMVNRQQCQGIKVHSARMFYPLNGQDSLKLFNPKFTDSVYNKTAYMMGVHYFNSQGRIKIEMGSGSTYDLIAQKYCPRIYDHHDDF